MSAVWGPVAQDELADLDNHVSWLNSLKEGEQEEYNTNSLGDMDVLLEPNHHQEHQHMLKISTLGQETDNFDVNPTMLMDISPNITDTIFRFSNMDGKNTLNDDPYRRSPAKMSDSAKRPLGSDDSLDNRHSPDPRLHIISFSSGKMADVATVTDSRTSRDRSYSLVTTSSDQSGGRELLSPTQTNVSELLPDHNVSGASSHEVTITSSGHNVSVAQRNQNLGPRQAISGINRGLSVSPVRFSTQQSEQSNIKPNVMDNVFRFSGDNKENPKTDSPFRVNLNVGRPSEDTFSMDMSGSGERSTPGQTVIPGITPIVSPSGGQNYGEQIMGTQTDRKFLLGNTSPFTLNRKDISLDSYRASPSKAIGPGAISPNKRHLDSSSDNNNHPEAIHYQGDGHGGSVRVLTNLSRYSPGDQSGDQRYQIQDFELKQEIPKTTSPFSMINRNVSLEDSYRSSPSKTFSSPGNNRSLESIDSIDSSSPPDSERFRGGHHLQGSRGNPMLGQDHHRTSTMDTALSEDPLYAGSGEYRSQQGQLYTVGRLPFSYGDRGGGNDSFDEGHMTQYLGDADVQITGEDRVVKRCLVCSDEATGMYFGALVCVPCKTFFLRYAGDHMQFVCKNNKNCDITISTRTQCKYCRFQKCVAVGMCRKERPAKVELSEGQQLCVVCQDLANGVHFGAITCEGCKKFFRRGLTENASYVCKLSMNCEINPRTRNSCRYCRFRKCLLAGMSREAIQMGRPSKFKPMGTPPTPTSTQSMYYGQQYGKDGNMLPPRSLSVNTSTGEPPLKVIKIEPMSPSSMDPYLHSPHMPPRMTSPSMLQQLSPGIGYSTEISGLYENIRRVNMGDVQGSGLGTEGSGNTNESMIQAAAQAAASSVLSSSSPTQVRSGMPAYSGASLTSPMSQVSNTTKSSDETKPSASNQSQATETQSHFTSSHQGSLSGGVATYFKPAYIEGNRRFITNEHIFNAFVQGALNNKVCLKDKKSRKKSRDAASTSSASSSRPDNMTDVSEFVEPELPPKDQATLNALTLPPSSSTASLSKASAVSGFPSEPSTPALSSPGSPNRLDIPGLDELEGIGQITGGNKRETVDYILFNQLMTPPSIENVDNSRTELVASSPKGLSPGDFSTENVTSPFLEDQQVPSTGSGLGSASESLPQLMTTKQEDDGGGGAKSVQSSNTIPSVVVKTSSSEGVTRTDPEKAKPQTISPATKLDSPAENYGSSRFSPMSQRSPADASNKSPGSSSSSSASSQFGDNGSVYDYIIELSKQIDLVKRNSDSDSECSEKDSLGTSLGTSGDLLSRDTADLNFKDFQDYWLKNTMPDENIMLNEDHYHMISQIEKVYRHFVETGTKINKKLRKELENWMKIHEGQFSAPPAWINEKVVPIYTLMSVTYCRNLPGFVEFHKSDQSTIIKLGQSQSRILVAARHWFDPEIDEFRDFMSWRGAKKGTEDSFKKELIAYARAVQKKQLDDIEAAFLNVLIIVATDYPELKNCATIEKHRKIVMDNFRAYTTAKYGTPNTRMEELFELIPRLRELGLKHHRMTFYMRYQRNTSTSSTS